jgi:plasmid stability protein
MAQVLIRGLDDETVARWKARAKANGRSLQAELREAIEQYATPERLKAAEVAAKIRKALKGKTRGDSTDVIREMRERWNR